MPNHSKCVPLLAVALACYLSFRPLPLAAQSDDRSLGEVARQAREHRPFDVQVTDEDQKEFFAAMDRILNFVSKDTGFPRRGAVKHQFVGRDHVNKLLAEGLAKAGKVDSLTRSELVLKKFGLLPGDYRLKDELTKAGAENLGGYYDPKDQTMYLLDWVRLELQRPVMAHELTHALQDQNFNLAEFAAAEEPTAQAADHGPISVSQPDEGERKLTHRAVIEGQATVVYLDYLLIPLDTTLAKSPEAQDFVSNRLEAYDLPIRLQNAPRVLKETTMFPYRAGLGFEVELLRRGGRSLAFAGTFKRMPSSEHQILHPDAYLAKTATPFVGIPDLRPLLGPDYELYDRGGVGELDARIMARDFGRENDLFSVAALWDGGGYVAVKRAGVPTEKLTPADISLLYLSRWKNAEAAKRFVEIYKTALVKREKILQEQTVDNMRCGHTACNGPLWYAKLLTSQGTDYLEILPGNRVFIAQSFPEALLPKLRELVANATSAQLATPPLHDLSLSLYESSVFAAFQEEVTDDLKRELGEAFGTFAKPSAKPQ